MQRFSPLPTSLKITSILIVAVLTLAGCLGGGGTGRNLPPQPVVTIEGGQNVLEVGQPIVFNGKDSTDDDSVSKYYWDLGDGEQTQKRSVTHTYILPGTYIVLLTVEDNDGAQATNDFHLTYVEVLPMARDRSSSSPPVAVVAANPSVARVGQQVQLSGGSSWAWVDSGGAEPNRDPKAITSYQWDFADGEQGSGALVNHTFALPGNYPVKLTVTSASGVAEAIQTIRVQARPTPTEGVKNPNLFTRVSIGEPEWLDPAHAYETAGGEVIMNVYETLIWYEGSSTKLLKPMLATQVPTVANGGLSEDGLVYTFHLRQGVKFHDGTEMTAEDAAFSLERVLIMDLSDGPSWMVKQVLNTTGITVLDAYTLQLTLERPYPAFLYIMAYTVTSVVSKNYVISHGGVIPGQRNEWMDEHTMGTGPYKLKEWRKDQHIILEKFDDYWGGWDEDRGYIDTVILKKDTELTSRELALLAGDADTAYIPVTFRSDVEGKPGIRILEKQPTFNLGFMGFNLNINLTGDPNLAPAADFFNDTKLRQAFSYSFDYDTFVNDIMAGSAKQPRGPIPEGMLGFDPNAPIYTFDRDRAEQLFKEAGVWESGFELTTYYNAGNTIREDGLLLLKNALETMNPKFKINIQALEWPTYLQKLDKGAMPLFFLGWAPDYADPDDYVRPFLYTGELYPYRISYSNPQMDALIDEASRELDPIRRIDLYKDIQQLAYEEAVFIWTAQAFTFHVERDWVQGYYYNPMYPGLYFYSLSKG